MAKKSNIQERVYDSMEQFIKEFTVNFAPVPVNVSSMWNAIIEYADINSEVGSEGNSGEFHDEKEEKRLAKIFKEKEQILIKQFAELTGYEPFFVENKTYPIYIQYEKQVGGSYYIGAWDFKKVK